MSKKAQAERPSSRSGPRAPSSKKPLMVIINQNLIKTAKIAAVEDDRKVFHIVEEALTEWLARRRKTVERKTA
jgi:hypothetical protein